MDLNIASAIRGLASVSWLIVIAYVIFVVIRASRRQSSPLLVRTAITLVVVAAALSTFSSGLVFIQPEERGVVISALSPKGYREQALEPGLRYIVPFAETVVIYPISRQTYTMSIAPKEGQEQGDDSVAARTADGQEIFIDASIIFAIDPSRVVDVHIAWQNRYANDLVRALARGIIRDAVSQFRVEEVITSKRFALTQKMHDDLSQKLQSNGITLTDFVLRNITFSPEYAASVEQKQISEQQAQQAKFIVEQRRQEAEQARQVAQGRADAAVIQSKGEAQARLINAEAEAKALSMIADSIKQNPAILTYQYVNKLAPGIQVMLVPNNAPFILPMPTPSELNFSSPSTGTTSTR